MNEEVWAEMERLSRRMALQYQEIMGRIIELEAEVEALKKAAEPICTDSVEQYEEPVETNQDWLDQNIADWREPGVANKVVERIMAE